MNRCLVAHLQTRLISSPFQIPSQFSKKGQKLFESNRISILSAKTKENNTVHFRRISSASYRAEEKYKVLILQENGEITKSPCSCQRGYANKQTSPQTNNNIEGPGNLSIRTVLTFLDYSLNLDIKSIRRKRK